MKRRKYIGKIVGLLLLAICIAPVSASAGVLSTSVDEDFVTDTMTVTGTFEEGKIPGYISLRVLKDGYSFDALPANSTYMDVTEYIKQISIADGATGFELSFVLTGNTRTLKAQISGEGFSEPWDLEIPYINEDEFCEAIDAVIGTFGSFESFATACKANNRMRALGFNYSIAPTVNSDDVLKLFYDSVKDCTPPLDRTNAIGTLNKWKTASLAVALNDGINVDLSDKLDCLEHFGSEHQKWVGFVQNNPNTEAKEKLYNLIVSKNYADIDKFKQCLTEALVLTVIKYPDGNGNIGTVLKGFSTQTGITTDNENAVYDKLAGNDYGSLADALKAYGVFKNDNPPPSGGGGGGGAGSGGSKVTNSVISVNPSQTGTLTQELLNMRFVDLDTVEWAYEAISTLADRKIISGKSDTLYAPLDTVSREEFVKMLVCAAGYENSSYTSAGFSDVADGAWYVPYVNIAAEKGMVSGIGQNCFGIGESISRQDMVVIIYRILESKGVKLSGTSLAFDDADKIANYAKEAVTALSANGVVSGVGNNLFNPTGTATRAEAAKIIFNVLDKIDS